jgi:hypothetical protein
MPDRYRKEWKELGLESETKGALTGNVEIRSGPASGTSGTSEPDGAGPPFEGPAKAEGRDTLRQRIRLWAFTWAVLLGPEGFVLLALVFFIIAAAIIADITGIATLPS